VGKKDDDKGKEEAAPIARLDVRELRPLDYKAMHSLPGQFEGAAEAALNARCLACNVKMSALAPGVKVCAVGCCCLLPTDCP
jgi:hypothetical protein